MKQARLLMGLEEAPPDGLGRADGPPAPPLRVIAVTSGKGGVGKSNIVANLGVALGRLGKKVLLIDADLGLANLDILLGVTPKYTIHDVFTLHKSLAQVVVPGPEGVKILPASSGFPELVDLNDAQKLFLLNELDHYSENLDVVLIDTGAGISRNVLFFNLAAMERIVVANNEPTSITDAYALMKVMVSQYGQGRFRLLVNRLSQEAEAQSVYRTLLKVAERFLGRDIRLDYLGFIPRDEHLARAVMKQRAVLEIYPQARASQSFLRLAHRLLESPGPPELDGNLKFFWRRLMDCQI